MRSQDCSPRLESCVFSENSATGRAWDATIGGGGLYCVGSGDEPATSEVIGCTFYRNRAAQDGGGVFSPGRIALRSCILWGNSNMSGFKESGQLSCSSYSSSVSHCCIQSLNQPSGNGNIASDPLLTLDGLHLLAGSPCIDQGDPGMAVPGDVDIDGESRIVGLGVDIGADEFVDRDRDTLGDWWELVQFGSTETCLPSDDPDNDGHDNLREYSDVTDPLRAPTTYHVSTIGDDDWDGLAANWNGTSGPKATIQAAINVAKEETWDEVVIQPGIYTGPGNRDLEFAGKEIVVRSVDPEDNAVVEQTIIDCQGSEEEPHRAASFHSRESRTAMLSGLTIRNGYIARHAGYTEQDGGAINCEASDPTIDRCVFTNNYSERYGGAICTTFSGSAIKSCAFRSNESAYGGGVLITCGNGLVIGNCVFAANSAMHGGGGLRLDRCRDFEVANCTFYGNSATSASGRGGGILADYYGTHPYLTNCIFRSNSDCYGSVERSQLCGTESTWLPSQTVIANCIQGRSHYSSSSRYGNIDAAPLFVDTTGVDGVAGTGDEDLHLLPWSPCIDAGNASSDYSLEPEPDGGRINMGAYGNTPEATSAGSLAIEGFVTVEIERIGRTLFSYELAVVLSNNSDQYLEDVVLELNEVPAGVTIADKTVNIGPLAPGATVTSADTFTVEVDRSANVDVAEVSWRGSFVIASQPIEAAISTWVNWHHAELSLGDVDSDGDVDLLDYSALSACMRGPHIAANAGCSSRDLDGNGFVDLQDYALMQRAFGR